jgi:hypothetical protein
MSSGTYVGELIETIDGIYMQGEGQLTAANGLIDVGTFERGWLREGTRTARDGSWHEGSFNDAGVPHGTGRRRTANGVILIGEFVEGVLTGDATIHFPNGNRYQGQVRNSQPAGNGTMFFENGNVSTGLWQTEVDGILEETVLQDGYVEMHFSDGSRYVGNFANGAYNGRGTYHWATGESLNVEWVDGRVDGYGIHRKADGSREAGRFVSTPEGGFRRVPN